MKTRLNEMNFIELSLGPELFVKQELVIGMREGILRCNREVKKKIKTKYYHILAG